MQNTVDLSDFVFFSFLAEETGQAASRPGLAFLYKDSFSRDVG